jgi:hypothetical protein
MTTSAPDPRIVRRFCGGYLAISTSSDGPKIGVTADTEEEARERLSATLKRWLEILDDATDRGPFDHIGQCADTNEARDGAAEP